MLAIYKSHSSVNGYNAGTISLTMAEATTRCAVVTGANKGIGLEICRQLAASGVRVVLTARDEKRGVEAFENLKASGLSNLIFHQLDVGDPASIASLSDFIKSQFGKLDILVNNAGISGSIVKDPAAYRSKFAAAQTGEAVNWDAIVSQPLGRAKECLKVNYYGPKRMVEAFLPLLHLSDSPRIVNVSSSLGKLQCVKHELAKAVLSDVENLTEERVDQVLKQFIKDYKEGSTEAKSWADYHDQYPAYVISKAALCAYTRIMAIEYPAFCVNCVCPGFVKTDLNHNTGFLTVEEGAAGPVNLALLPHGGPSGQFFCHKELSHF